MIADNRAEATRMQGLATLKAQEWCIAAVRIQREALKRARWCYLDSGELNEIADELAKAAALLASAAQVARQEYLIATRGLPESVRYDAPMVEIVVVRRSVRKKTRRDSKG
jgi:hypothetical protein